ncbi:MAG: DNA polymerase III subunit gamma/tau, partial [Corynebacterium sp.]|nr:DNA polymerase III subunit gamma/tau [Corynebacterium sp.]
QWSEVRRSIAQRNKNAGIMLTEARVLGEKDGTIVLGHTTGALAQRLNVDPNNADIVAVITDMLGATFKVHCVVGTDPKVAGFSPAPSPKPVWNPHEEAQEAPAPSPTAEPHNSQEPDTAAPQPSPQSSVQAPAQVASSSDSGWGTPRPLGGQSEQSTREMPQPAPVQKASVGSEGRPSAGNSAAAPAGREAGSTDWRDKIAQAQQLTQQREQEQRNSGTFSNGVPLPPEPGPEEYPEEDGGPYDYAPAGSAPTHTPRNEENAAGNSTALSDSSVPSAPLTQEDEEREMIEAAQQQGERDHRSATEVAMDLLASELGARRL